MKTRHTSSPFRISRLQVEPLEARCLLHSLALTPLVQVSGTSPFFGNPIEANDPPSTINAETLPHLAVNPNNPRHMVATWTQDFARGVLAAVSTDGGDSWRPVSVPGTSVAAGGIYPHVTASSAAFTADGDVYLTMVGHNYPDINSPNAILICKSTDGGMTWGTPASFASKSGHFVSGPPFLAADPTNPDTIYAAWTRLTSNIGINVCTQFTRTINGGQSWEPVRTIHESANVDNNVDHQILVLPGGTLVDLFVEEFWSGQNLQGAEVSAMRSTDGGMTWSSRRAVAHLPASIVSDPESGAKIVANYMDAAVDPRNGNIYAVWRDATFGNGQFDSIAFSMSSNGGLSWSQPLKINQTPTNIPPANQQAFIPSIAVNRDGVVAVTYYDFRNNTPDAGLPTDYWMLHAHPSDGLTNPASWRSENRLNTAPFNMEDAVFAYGQYIVGGYQGLVAQGRDFGALFAMPHGSDHCSIFYRDPPPADQNSQGKPIVRSGSDQITSTFVRSSQILDFGSDDIVELPIAQEKKP